jgi:hypothetical protein
MPELAVLAAFDCQLFDETQSQSITPLTDIAEAQVISFRPGAQVNPELQLNVYIF